MKLQVRWLLLRALSNSPGAAADALPRALVKTAAAGNAPRLWWLLDL